MAVVSSVSRAETGRVTARPGALFAWSILLLIGHFPILLRFVAEQWGRPAARFSPLILIAAAYIAWHQRKQLDRTPDAGSPAVTRVICVAAVVLLIGACAIWSGQLGAASALLLLAGLVWGAGGKRLVAAMAPVLVLLAMVVGLPQVLDDAMMQRVRDMVLYCSSALLAWLRVPHLLSGTILEIPGGRLLVSDLASGIYAIVPAFAFTLLYCTLRRRRWLSTTILLLLSLIFVPLVSIVYVAGGVWAIAKHGADIFSGSASAWVAPCILGVSLALVLSGDMVIRVILEARRVGRHLGSAAPVRRAAHSSRAEFRIHLSKGAWLLAWSVTLIGCVQLARGGVNDNAQIEETR